MKLIIENWELIKLASIVVVALMFAAAGIANMQDTFKCILCFAGSAITLLGSEFIINE